METIIISLGGSIIAPHAIDTIFLKNFRKLILKHVNKGKQFVIICGGGHTARLYQSAAYKILKVNPEDLDWLGIHATRLNAHLLRTIFREQAHPAIIKNPTEKVKTKKPVVIAAGWKPGFSTDYDSVLLAKNFGSKTVLNLSDIKYVYTKDPKKFKGARPLKHLNWPEFLKILPQKWSPGLKAPFDPVAARLAEKLKLKVLIASGRDTKNLDAFLSGKKFNGSVVE